MATWQQVFDRAKRRYGLATDTEDLLLVDGLFMDRVNELLSELAHVGGGCREELTLDLPLSPTLPLSERVIRIVDGTVRVDYDGDGIFEQEPKAAQEEELRAEHGVLENQSPGAPQHYYTQRGAVAGEMLNLVLFPRSDLARAGAVKLWARTTPVPISGPANELPLQQGEERFLVPGICLALAEAEASRGGQQAPVALWDARWERALRDFADLVEDGLRGDQRCIGHAGV
ncbi:MAG: hypothetical protein ACO1SX_04155 [Actinomycetota bacterium]